MTTMYDSDNPDSIPDGVMAAGYCDGYAAAAWNARGWQRFPNAWRIAVSPFTNDGNVLDVETGDATPQQAPSWGTMRRAAGIDPIVYVQESRWGEVQAAFHQQGVAAPHYWIAKYDGVPSIPAGAIAKQYANQAIIPGHPHYDLSIVAETFGGNAQGGSVVLSEKRALVRLAYLAALGRQPETQAVLDGWATTILDDGSNADNVLISITAGDEAKAHLAAVAKVVAGSGGAPDTDSEFALKTHVHVVGSSQTGPSQ